MSQAHTKAAPEAVKAAAAPPARALEAEPAKEHEEDASTPFVQRAVGGSSHAAPPASYGALLGQLNGSSTAQVGLLQQLQQRYGNNYVGRVLQAKLNVSQPNDPSEMEADRMAEAVMRMPDDKRGATRPAVKRAHGAQRKCEKCGGGAGAMLVGRTCAKCESEEKLLQAKPEATTSGGETRGSAGGGAPPGANGIEPELQSFAGGGQPLDTSERSFFEPRMNYDFGEVRIHTDTRSAEAARALNARAFTFGENIVFGASQYAPGTPQGRSLLAHELAHVVQQNSHADVSPCFIQRQNEATGGLSTPQATSAPAAQQNATTPAAPPATPPPDAGSNTFTHTDGIVVSDDVAYDKYVLENIASTNSIAHEIQWVADFKMAIRQYPGDVGLTLRTNVLQAVEQAHDELSKDFDDFVKEFEKRAYAVVGDMLAESQKQIETERMRYGLEKVPDPNAQDDPTNPNPETRATGTPATMASMMDNAATRGLAEAARQLANKREEIKALNEKRNNVGPPMPLLTAGHASLTPGLDKEIEQKEHEYRALRTALKERYPFLAAISNPGDLDKLQQLASAPTSPETAAMVAKLTDEKLKNIEEVREELAKESDGKVKVWKLPHVLGLTSIQMGIKPGSLEHAFFEFQKSQAGGELWKTAASILAFALAITPLPGAQAASFAIGAVLISKDIEEFLFEQAATGTHLDRAEAVSREDPSLFWLAVDILGTLADAKDAVKSARELFKALAPKVRKALKPASREAAEEALKEVGDAGRKAKLPHLGTKVGEMRAQQGLVEAARGEVLKAERAGMKALDDVGAIVESAGPIAAGHRVKVTEGGWLVRCTMCRMIREEYAAELIGHQDLIALLHASEDLSQRAAAARKAGDLEGARRLGQQAVDTGTLLIGHLDDIRKANVVSPEMVKLAELRGGYADELISSPAMRDKLRAAEDLAAKAAAARKAGDEEAAAELAKRAEEVSSGLRADLDAARRSTVKDAVLKATAKYDVDPAQMTAVLERIELSLTGMGLEPDAVTRVLSKAPNIDHMRGALLEEMTAKQVKKSLAEGTYTPGGLLGDWATSGPPEFFGGHRLRTRAGEEIGDGVTGHLVRDSVHGDMLYVDKIYENKAGRSARRDLKSERENVMHDFDAAKKGFEAQKKAAASGQKIPMRKGKVPDSVQSAIDELRDEAEAAGIKDYSGMKSWEIYEKYPDRVRKRMEEFPSTEPGQLERTHERMSAALEEESNVLLLDGREVTVVAVGQATPKVTALPSDVKFGKMPKTLEHLTVEHLPGVVSSQDLMAPFKELDDFLKAAEAAKKAAKTPAATPAP